MTSILAPNSSPNQVYTLTHIHRDRNMPNTSKIPNYQNSNNKKKIRN